MNERWGLFPYSGHHLSYVSMDGWKKKAAKISKQMFSSNIAVRVSFEDQTPCSVFQLMGV